VAKKFSADYQPKKRGRSKRKMIIDALERQGQSEEGFYDVLVKEALFNDNSTALVELLRRFHPVEKPTLPNYEFEFPQEGTMLEKADAIVMATGSGIIPVDVAKYFIDVIDARASIEEKQELSERVAKLEEMLLASQHTQ